MSRILSVSQLRAAGAAIARVHAIPREPGPHLPLRTRPTQVDDRARERRWAAPYGATAEADRAAVVDAFVELTGSDASEARGVLTGARQTPLLQFADELVREIPMPQGETVFVHGDIWAGNIVWAADASAQLIDWKTSGVGDPGVDIGSLRMQMALQYGQSAPPHVLDGWQAERGRMATNVAYWDAIAALNTPADLAGWGPAWDEAGEPLDGPGITARRDAFLRAAIDDLRTR